MQQHCAVYVHQDLSTLRTNPQARFLHGRQLGSLPLPHASGAPSTLTIFRPPSPEASTFPNGFGPPPLPAPSAESPASQRLWATFPMALGHLPERLWACHQSYPRPLLQQQISPPATCPPSWTEVLVQPLMAPPVQRLIKSMELQPSLLRMHPSLQLSSERRPVVARAWQLIEGKGLVFFYHPHQRRGYNRAQTCMRRCLIVILTHVSPKGNSSKEASI